MYLWFSFTQPIQLTDENRDCFKTKCRLWQKEIIRKCQPEKYNLKIDGCFDLSRLKRVIGTFNHKAQRGSWFIEHVSSGQTIEEKILSIDVHTKPHHKERMYLSPSTHVPYRFKRLLKWDTATNKLWQNPDPQNDTSRHDWKLGISCVHAGITKPQELATILMNNPHGKYRRDLRWEYVALTVRKILEEGALEVVNRGSCKK